MALGDLPVHRLLDPADLVHQPVAVLAQHLKGEAVLGVDDPDEEEAMLRLELVEWDP